MNTVIKYFLLAALLFISLQVNAQSPSSATVHVMELENGTTLIGKLLVYTEGQPVQIEMLDKSIITVPYDDIVSIQKSKNKISGSTIKDSAHKSYIFNDRKWHYGLSYGLINQSGSRFSKSGYFLNGSAHYHVKEWLGVGIHVGYDVYDERIEVVPVALSVKGYLFNKKLSPYYEINIGHGFSTTDYYNNRGSESMHEGGFYFNPKVGLRLSNDRAINLLLFTGIKMQQYRSGSSGCQFIEDCGDYREVNLDIKRFIVGFGMVF